MHPFASLARAVFLKGFLLMEITHRELSRPRYRPPTPVLASESEKKIESIFRSLIFFNLRYIKRRVKGNNNIGIKVQKKFLMGFKF